MDGAPGGFVNPYGIEGVTYTTMAYGNADVQRTILEMQATTLRTGFFTGIVPVTLCFALAAAYVRRPVPLRHLLLAGGTMLMALLSVRRRSHAGVSSTRLLVCPAKPALSAARSSLPLALRGSASPSSVT